MLDHSPPPRIGNGRFSRILTTIVALVLLPAVPVSALTFLTPWNITQKQKNAAPVAVTVADAIPSLGSLLVDMEDTTSPKASSSVTATRRIRVGSSFETIAVYHEFETLLSDAKLDVTISIFPSFGFRIPKTSFKIGPNMSSVARFSNQFTGRLPAGEYNVTIKINYKAQNGGWDNRPPGSNSPHTFTIASI